MQEKSAQLLHSRLEDSTTAELPAPHASSIINGSNSIQRLALGVDKNSLRTPHKIPLQWSSCRSTRQMLYVDTKTWLPDDLLIRPTNDHGNSLELRVPLLDHKISSLPPHAAKLQNPRFHHSNRQESSQRLRPSGNSQSKKGWFPVPYENGFVSTSRTGFVTFFSTPRRRRGLFSEGCCRTHALRRIRSGVLERDF